MIVVCRTLARQKAAVPRRGLGLSCRKCCESLFVVCCVICVCDVLALGLEPEGVDVIGREVQDAGLAADDATLEQQLVSSSRARLI